jgi:hypothetical protein
MAIHKQELPNQSVLKQTGIKYDFIDSFEGMYSDGKTSVDMTEVGKAFFAGGPRWVEKLFSVRNKIVKLFGLKISDPVADRRRLLEAFRCEPGESMGLFKVYTKNEQEVVLGEDDKHLDFRVSLFVEPLPEGCQKKLTVSTTIRFNNWFGRVYFLPVRPFHKMIVPVMLRGMLRSLGQN